MTDQNRSPEADVEPAPQPATPTTARASKHRWDAPVGIGVSIVAAVIGLFVAIWLVLFITKGRFLKPTFEKYASQFSERTIRVAGDFQFYFAPLDVKFLAEGLTVSNPEWASRDNFWESKLIDVRLKTLPLIFGGNRIVEWINLDGARIDAEWDPRGQRNTWTFGDPNKKGEPFELPTIRRAAIAGTELRYRDPVLQLLADIRFQTIRAQDTQFANSIRFSGGGSIRQRPFTLNGALHSPNEALAGGNNRFELHANAARTRMDVSGTLPGVTQIEGADLNMRVRGQNLQNLFEVIGVVVPDTRSYDLRSNVTKAGDEWRFTRLTGRFGESDLAGRMTISMPNNRLNINADLASRVVDIVDIGPFIGYEPNALATQGVQAAVAQTGGTPRILPDAPLRIEAIKNFDAHVVYKVRDIRAPNVPVSNVALTFDLKDRLMTLSPLTADMAGGHVAADISINARVPAVVTEYDIRLSPTPMGKLLAGFGVAESGTTGTIKARVQMKGTGDSLRDSLATSNGRIAIILPRGTFWTQYIQLSEFDVGVFIQKMFEEKLKDPVQVNCGLIGFTVRNGVAAADPILIDTSKNVMTAKGGFSFKNESLDLAFRADGKKFSLFSGQSPVGIGGYFAAPSIDIISPELIARGGAGLALGIAASPLAAVLAFVDVGDAKDAACGPVLAGATAAAQRTDKGERRKDVGKVSDNRDKARTGANEEKKDKKFLGIF